MSKDIAMAIAAPDHRDLASVHENADVLTTVKAQESLGRLVPKLIFCILIGGPLIMSVLKEGTITIWAIVGAVIWYFIAKFFVWIVRELLLTPLENRRFKRAAAKLRQRLKANWPLSLGPYAWTLGAPGALGATSDGDLVVVDRRNQYRELKIPARCITDVGIRCRSELVTTTKGGGRALLGTAVGSFGLGYATGSRSTSSTRQIDDYDLEIRYQLERNGTVDTQIVPGGNDHRVVEELRAAISRVEGATS